jgi:hypothetical protein
MKVWTLGETAVALAAALTVVAALAAAYPVAPQNSQSKALLALPAAEADRVRRRDLLAALQPGGEFLTDLNRNVYGMTFVTWPYSEGSFVCREDRLTLRYGREDVSGKPQQIETQALFYVNSEPSLSATDRIVACDKRHPGPNAHWMEAPTGYDAYRAAYVFRKAEKEVAAGELKPELCGRPGPDACREWIVSLNDPSKINAVDTCAPGADDDFCYVISFDDNQLTIRGTMSDVHHQKESTTVRSIKVEEVLTIIE